MLAFSKIANIFQKKFHIFGELSVMLKILTPEKKGISLIAAEEFVSLWRKVAQELAACFESIVPTSK